MRVLHTHSLTNGCISRQMRTKGEFEHIMSQESRKNPEFRKLAELLNKVAFHRGEMDKLWVQLEALQTKMKRPKRSKRRKSVAVR